MNEMTAAGDGIYHLPVTIKTVGVDRSGQWLVQGWRDVWRKPAISLAYGFSFVLISYVLTFGLLELDLGALIPPLVGAFILVSPVLVVGLYEVARRLKNDEPVGFGDLCVVCMRNAGQVAAMGVVMLIFAFFWVVIAIVLFALFFSSGVPPLESLVYEILFSVKGAIFLSLGTVLGAGLATLIFSISAVSIPMLLDHPRLDVVTAVATSFLAVRANWRTMFGWAALIGLISVVAVVTFYIGLAIAMPMLAYATWHAYEDIIEIDDNDAAGTADAA